MAASELERRWLAKELAHAEEEPESWASLTLAERDRYSELGRVALEGLGDEDDGPDDNAEYEIGYQLGYRAGYKAATTTVGRP
jgi:hypothetical protein